MVSRILQILTRRIAQATFPFAQALPALLERLHRSHSSQALARIRPAGLALAPAVFDPAQQAALQVVEQLQRFVEPTARMGAPDPLHQSPDVLAFAFEPLRLGET